MVVRYLLDELKRRGVYRVCVAYVLVAFALLQGADIVLPALGFPPPVLTAVVALAIVGLPVAAALAWIFDITPRGLERTERPSGTGVSRTAAAAGLLGVVVVSLLVATGAWLGVRYATRAPPIAVADGGAPAGEASVAVLPCSDVTASPERAYFGDGMTEEIIGELARFEGLKVISRTSVMALRGTALTVPQIADTLGVRHVLECSVQRSGDRVRVRATLIDPRADANVWTEAYDRDVGDVAVMQQEIARQVGTALLARIPEIRPAARQARSPAPAAYDAYLRGTAARRQSSRAGLVDAIAAFEESIALEPLFAPAYSGLAQVHVAWTLFGYPGGADAYQRIAAAFAFAERAVALDSTLAEAYAARAHASLRAWLPHDVVLADADRAVRLAPNSGEIRLLRGVALAFAGRFDDAVQETAAAIALDPLAPGHHDFRAMSLVLSRRYEEALRAARTARSLAPDFPNPIRQEMRALLLLGRFDECARGEVGPYLPLRAMCLHSLGRAAEARALIDSLAERLDSPDAGLTLNVGGVAGDIAEYFAWTGDVSATLGWLRRSIDVSPSAQFLVLHTATYDRVRSDPRFEPEIAAIRGELRRRIEALPPTPGG